MSIWRSPFVRAALPATVGGVSISLTEGEAMRYVLGALFLAAGMSQADASNAYPIRLGMNPDEVDKILGTPICHSASVVGLFLGSRSVYQQVDWLGGKRTVCVNFDADSQATDCSVQYRLFAAWPGWLDSVRYAILGAEKQP